MNLLRGSKEHSASVASLFDIRIESPERDVIVMRGSPSDCSGMPLKGVVVLSLQEAIQARNITLRLYGTSRVQWTESFLTANRTNATRQQKEESFVYDFTWSFLPFAGTKTIGKGNYEYPFEVQLPGDIPESVEGLEQGSVIYRMHASIDRPTFAHNLNVRKRIRIIRTLGADAELAQTLSVDNTWPGKIEYAISIPTKSYPIGSAIPINFKLVPLLKGLIISKIVCVLKEYASFNIAHGHHGAPARTEVDRNLVTRTILELPAAVDCWELNETLSIPNTLKQCVQDCEVTNIKVRHKLKFSVSLKNPDGHVSELRAALPVSLLMPPILFSSGGPAASILDPNDPSNQLPSYDHHVYDRLWDGISLESPLTSGQNTPGIRSRRNSDEHIREASTDGEQQRRQLMASLHRLTETDPSANQANFSHHSYAVTPSVLSGTTSPVGSYYTPSFLGAGNTETDLSTSLAMSSLYSGQAAPGAGMVTPEVAAQEDSAALSRIPSYATANVAPVAPLSLNLPQYEEVMSNDCSNGTSPPETHHNIPLLNPPNIPVRPEAARTTMHRMGVSRAAHDRVHRTH